MDLLICSSFCQPDIGFLFKKCAAEITQDNPREIWIVTYEDVGRLYTLISFDGHNPEYPTQYLDICKPLV